LKKLIYLPGNQLDLGGGYGMRMDHPIGSGDEDARRGCKRIRKPVFDKGTGKNGTSTDKTPREVSQVAEDR